MRSVADDLRQELRDRVKRLHPRDRVALAWRLGEDDLARLMRAQGLTREEAMVVFARARAAGRRPSGASAR